MTQKEPCKELRAEYCLSKGILATAPSVRYIISESPTIVCNIEQSAIRTISIKADVPQPLNELYSCLTVIERLLVIFDGVFIPLTGITFPDEEDNKDNLDKLAKHIMVQRLNYFRSAKYLTFGNDSFVDYWDCIHTVCFRKWKDTLDELGVLHQMFLYASSDTSLTNDVMAAFLIELMEGLSEFFREKFAKFKEKNPVQETCLADGITSMINCFGDIIFSSEKKSGKNIVKTFVNSRVNIMHIKRKQKTPMLNGEEATLYAIKMNYLYRWSILEYLGVPTDLYSGTVAKRIERLDAWNNILPRFLSRIE